MRDRMRNAERREIFKLDKLQDQINDRIYSYAPNKMNEIKRLSILVLYPRRENTNKMTMILKGEQIKKEME